MGMIKTTENKVWQGRAQVGTVYIAGENISGADALENWLAVPQKIQHRITT